MRQELQLELQSEFSFMKRDMSLKDSKEINIYIKNMVVNAAMVGLN